RRKRRGWCRRSCRRSRPAPRSRRCSSAWPRSTPISRSTARAAPTSSRPPRGSSTRPAPAAPRSRNVWAIVWARGPTIAQTDSRSTELGGELEVAVVDAFEELALAARAPELDLGVALGAQANEHERRTDAHVDAGDGTGAAAIETVGEADERGELL